MTFSLWRTLGTSFVGEDMPGARTRTSVDRNTTKDDVTVCDLSERLPLVATGDSLIVHRPIARWFRPFERPFCGMMTKRAAGCESCSVGGDWTKSFFLRTRTHAMTSEDASRRRTANSKTLSYHELYCSYIIFNPATSTSLMRLLPVKLILSCHNTGCKGRRLSKIVANLCHCQHHRDKVSRSVMNLSCWINFSI